MSTSMSSRGYKLQWLMSWQELDAPSSGRWPDVDLPEVSTSIQGPEGTKEVKQEWYHIILWQTDWVSGPLFMWFTIGPASCYVHKPLKRCSNWKGGHDVEIVEIIEGYSEQWCRKELSQIFPAPSPRPFCLMWCKATGISLCLSVETPRGCSAIHTLRSPTAACHITVAQNG